jgi:hypothetical protein
MTKQVLVSARVHGEGGGPLQACHNAFGKIFNDSILPVQGRVEHDLIESLLFQGM